MSFFKSTTIKSTGALTIALALALPVFAAETQAAPTISCKQARADLLFMQQLAMTDGGTNPYVGAPLPAECKSAEQMAKSNAAKKRPAEDKSYSGAAPAH